MGVNLPKYIPQEYGKYLESLIENECKSEIVD